MPPGPDPMASSRAPVRFEQQREMTKHGRHNGLAFMDDAALVVDQSMEIDTITTDEQVKEVTKRDVVVRDDDQPFFTCEICYCEDTKMSSSFNLGCNHSFFSDCWVSNVQNTAGEGAFHLLMLSCPSNGCKIRLSPSDIEIIAPDSLERWQRSTINAMIDQDSTIFVLPWK